MLALPEHQEDLVEFIRKKEQKEQRTRLIRLGLLFTVLLGAGGYFIWQTMDFSQADKGPMMRKYQIEQLTRSQVTSLFNADPSPILVEDKTLGRIDTVKSVQEYLLVLSSIHDATLSLPTQEASNILRDGEEGAGLDTGMVHIPENFSEPFTEADVMPAFPGGEPALYRFLSSQIRYPADALRNKVEGKVFVRFIIQPDGTLTDVKVMKGIGYGCNEEAIRVVRMMPAWIPGEIAGRKVPVFSSLAVNFKFL
ncbi:MAG: energy transducer TonB [Bacteroidia bacterium]|nr:energy transducer TonB [Bacteroidia bacterium]